MLGFAAGVAQILSEETRRFVRRTAYAITDLTLEQLK